MLITSERVVFSCLERLLENRERSIIIMVKKISVLISDGHNRR